MKKVVLAVLCTSVSCSALAADIVTEVTPAPVSSEVASTFAWDGIYAGLGMGGGWSGVDFDVLGLHASRNFNGGLASGFAGYNYQIDNFVIGVEGDFTYNWNEKTIRALGGSVDVGSDLAGSVRGRLGYTFDRALIYTTAGWTATNGYLEAKGEKKSRVFDGWTAGLGTDFAVTDSIFVRAEYRYSDFGSKNISGLKVGMDQHTAMFGVGFKF